MPWLRTKLKNVEDLPVALTLWLVAAAAVIVVAFVPSSSARDTFLKLVGGAVVLLGSYFAARTLKQTRADQRATRILKAIELVGNEHVAVRAGALWTLVDLANSSDGERESSQVPAIVAVLDTACATDADSTYKGIVAEIQDLASKLPRGSRQSSN